MLGLVDYSSDEESVPATQIKSQTIASTDGVEATTLKSSSADADLTNKTSQVVSQRIKKSKAKQKRKRSTRDIVSALGLDKELEEILNDEKKEDAINDHFEEVRTTTRSTKRQKKITTTTTAAAAITNQLNEESEVVSAYQSTTDRDIDNDDYDMNNRQQQAPLLSDDFFDHLHEYQVPDVPSQYEASMDASTYLYPGGGSSRSEDVVGATAFGSTSSSSISQEHLPAEVLRDLQRSSASIIEVNSMNRGSSYLDEVMKRQLAAEKHKNLTAGQSTGQIPQKAISNTQRSRNQLSYLAHNAQVNELENAERAAAGRANKQAAWRKYGWM